MVTPVVVGRPARRAAMRAMLHPDSPSGIGAAEDDVVDVFGWATWG